MWNSLHLLLLCACVMEGSVSSETTNMPLYKVSVTLGSPFTLECAYNCSPFVRGCWSKEGRSSVCFGEISKNCTVVHRIPKVSAEDLGSKYFCYTQKTDDPQLRQSLIRVISLQLQAPTTAIETMNTVPVSVPSSSDGNEGLKEGMAEMKILVVVVTSVGTVLVALFVFLCLNRRRMDENASPVAQLSRSRQPSVSLQSQSERAPVALSESDNSSDKEVPYADIMITVRGASSPELSQIGYLTPDKRNGWSGAEPRCQLQLSRSADRLHLPQAREISRKMSSTSEYAIITYA